MWMSEMDLRVAAIVQGSHRGSYTVVGTLRTALRGANICFPYK